jgi:exopolysaccharide biosynthesis polyprenyl glycosylphosphotransferase
MLKGKEQILSFLLGLFDVIISLTSFCIAFYIRHRNIIFNHEYIILIILFVPIWFTFFKLTGLSAFNRAKPYAIIFLDYIIVNVFGIIVLFFIIFLLKLESISRIVLFIFIPISIFSNYTIRIAIKEAFKYYRRKGYNTRNLLIIADETSQVFIDKIIKDDFLGYKIKVIFTDSEIITNKYLNDYSVLPENTNISQFLELEAIDEAIYLKENINLEEVKEMIYACDEIGVSFHVQSPLFNMIATKAHINYFFQDIPFLTFSKHPTNYLALKLKSLIDYIVASLALIFSLAFLLLIAVLIKIDSKGPIFFKQTRVGKNGRLFKVFKFRTMITDAEELKEKLADLNEQSGPVFKMKNDPRVTRIGRFLRKTSLDEFPQFINVILGHMSIVGPRPPVPQEVEQYKRWQLRRLSMKPGITCIWQVSGRNKIGFEDWMKLDLQYIDNWSLQLDFILILKTIKVIFASDGL